MRAVAALAALALLAGCSSATIDDNFIAMARAAPAQLQADMGPSGELTSIEGTMQVKIHMEGDGRKMDMPMDMEMLQEFYAGGAYHMQVAMTGSMMGESMSATMHIACSPERIHIWGDGMPEAEMDVRLDNKAGRCEGGAELMEALGDDVDDETRSMLSQMSSSDLAQFTDLTYKDARVEGGKAYAIYESRVDGLGPGMGMGMASGSSMNAKAETKATFEDGRIATLLITAHSNMSMDMGEQSFSMTMDMEGEFELSYGTRDTIPASLL